MVTIEKTSNHNVQKTSRNILRPSSSLALKVDFYCCEKSFERFTLTLYLFRRTPAENEKFQRNKYLNFKPWIENLRKILNA